MKVHRPASSIGPRSDGISSLTIQYMIAGPCIWRCCKIGRAKDNAEIPGESFLANHRRANRVTNGATRTVGADEVAATHGRRPAAVNVAQLRGNAASCLQQRHEFGFKMDRHAGKRLRILPQDFFQDVLRNPLRFFGMESGSTPVKRVFKAGNRRSVHARRKHDCGRTVRSDRRCPAKRVGNTQRRRCSRVRTLVVLRAGYSRPDRCVRRRCSGRHAAQARWRRRGRRDPRRRRRRRFQHRQLRACGGRRIAMASASRCAAESG